jgi:hypothetical protein
MDYILSSNTNPNMGYIITNGQTILDLTLDKEVMSYGLSFWKKLFQYITDDMYIDPFDRKLVRKFYVNLHTLKKDFVIQLNEHDSLQTSGDKVYYNYRYNKYIDIH